MCSSGGENSEGVAREGMVMMVVEEVEAMEVEAVVGCWRRGR